MLKEPIIDCHPCESLAEITADSPEALLLQIDAMCELMHIDRRPAFDLERRMLLAIRRGVETLANIRASSYSLG